MRRIPISLIKDLSGSLDNIISRLDQGGGSGTGSSGSPGWIVNADGTGSSQNITLPEATTADSVAVYVNGLRYLSNEFSITGTTLTITAITDSKILVQKFGSGSGSAGTISAPPLDGLSYARQGEEWVPVARGVSFGIQGKTTAGEDAIPYGIIPYAFTPNGLQSVASSIVAATASTQFLIRSGISQIGTLTFAANSTVGVFAFTGAFVKDTAFTLVPPSTPDATLSGISGFISAGAAPGGGYQPGGGGGEVVGGV